MVGGHQLGGGVGNRRQSLPALESREEARKRESRQHFSSSSLCLRIMSALLSSPPDLESDDAICRAFLFLAPSRGPGPPPPPAFCFGRSQCGVDVFSTDMTNEQCITYISGRRIGRELARGTAEREGEEPRLMGQPAYLAGPEQIVVKFPA